MKLSEIPDGYTQIIKIMEKGLNGHPKAVRLYAEKYIELHPNGVYAKPFRTILDNKSRNLACMDKWIRAKL